MKDQRNQLTNASATCLLSCRKRVLCALMALLMIISPVMVSAKSAVESLDHITSELLVSDADDLSDMSMANCHKMNKHQDLSSSQIPQPFNESQHQDTCCIEACECDESGCHSPTATLGTGKLIVNDDSAIPVTFISSYLSLFSPPNFRPPIS